MHRSPPTHVGVKREIVMEDRDREHERKKNTSLNDGFSPPPPSFFAHLALMPNNASFERAARLNLPLTGIAICGNPLAWQ
jgi:hypothetical protein